MSKKIAIALSGGVDSSVSAYLLKKAGADLTAVYIRFYARNEAEKKRIGEEANFAKQIADHLKIKFKILDYSNLQKEKVVNHFLNSYQLGKSPNPCLECNRLLKFGEFYDWALNNGFEQIATGHYAQIVESNGKHYLASAQDKNKDQSYFLYSLKEEQLKNIIFPLGELLKNQVRQIASEKNLPSKKSKESFDICFLNQTTPRAFLQKNLGSKTGNLVDSNGQVIGLHQGAHYYTIGQRQGFSVNHKLLKNSNIQFNSESPPALFVIAKDVAKNQLVLGTRESCFHQEFNIQSLHFINQEYANKKQIYARVKVRNTGQLIACQMDIKSPKTAVVKLEKKIFALAPGQGAVFYQEKQHHLVVIGGGEIC